MVQKAACIYIILQNFQCVTTAINNSFFLFFFSRKSHNLSAHKQMLQNLCTVLQQKQLFVNGKDSQVNPQPGNDNKDTNKKNKKKTRKLEFKETYNCLGKGDQIEMLNLNNNNKKKQIWQINHNV